MQRQENITALSSVQDLKKKKTFPNERFRGGRPVENVLFIVHFLLFIAQK